MFAYFSSAPPSYEHFAGSNDKHRSVGPSLSRNASDATSEGSSLLGDVVINLPNSVSSSDIPLFDQHNESSVELHEPEVPCMMPMHLSSLSGNKADVQQPTTGLSARHSPRLLSEDGSNVARLADKSSASTSFDLNKGSNNSSSLSNAESNADSKEQRDALNKVYCNVCKVTLAREFRIIEIFLCKGYEAAMEQTLLQMWSLYSQV